VPRKSELEHLGVTYRGVRFYPYSLARDRNGGKASFYYRTNQQPYKYQLLHRLVWEDAHGPIPDGYVVHHRDGDSLNNAVDNLELLPRGEHIGHHKKGRPAAYADPDVPSKRSKAMWAKRQPRDVECVACGTIFQSTGMRAMFCTRPCRRRYYLDVRGY
jgi:hypothetical protein